MSSQLNNDVIHALAGSTAATNSVEKVPDFFNSEASSHTQKEESSAGSGGEQVEDLFTKSPISALADENVLEAIPAPSPPRMGRPLLLTPALAEQLCMLLSIGLSRRQAASYLDIDPSTISKAAARDADLAYNMQRAEEIAAMQPYIALASHCRKNWRAATWLIEHRRKYPPALTEEEKAQRDQERLAEKRREIEYARNVTLLHAESRDIERIELARQQHRRQEEASRSRRKPR